MTDGAVGPPSLPISVTEIRRRPGSRKPITRTLESNGLALSDVGVVDGVEVRLDGTLESISEGVVLTGTVAVPWAGSCRRCLRDITGTAAVEVREIYETHPTDGETWPMANEQIDVGPLLHDTALLGLPLAPLCKDDCRGPVPEQFPAGLPEDAADVEDEPTPDPRWAALDDLEF